MYQAFRRWQRRVYDFNIGNRDEWVKAWAQRIPSGSRVIDVGAGSGRYRSLFAHCEYRTQDFGQEPATIGRYTRLDYECDILNIPVADGSFDVVLCTEVLEHVPQPTLAVREMGRILRKGGTLLLTAPLGSSLHQEPYHFYGGYTPHWYNRFLGEAGFTVRSIESNQGFYSWFGQELWRFRFFLAPANTRRLSFGRRLLTTLLWALSWPFVKLVPPLSHWLDAQGLEREATIGYHVVAERL